MPDISPDIDARFCYLVVAICGALSAWKGIYERIGLGPRDRMYAWGAGWRMWFVFTLYVAFPVVLYWFLDRLGTIRDTSFFSAVAVGLGYVVFLNRKGSAEQTGGFRQVWERISDETKTFAAMAVSYYGRVQQDFRQRIVGILVSECSALGGSGAKFEAVKRLALQALEEPGMTDAKNAFHAELGAAAADCQKRAEIVVEFALMSELRAGIFAGSKKVLGIGRFEMPYCGPRLRCGTYFCLLFLTVCALGWTLWSRTGEPEYLCWRLGKSSTTMADTDRAELGLERYLSDPEMTDQVRALLVARLRKSDLNAERASKAITLLLNARNGVHSPEFRKTTADLVLLLKGAPLEVRLRAHDALLLLAHEDRGTESAELNTLEEWRPNSGDTEIAEQRKWRSWQQWWNSNGQSTRVRSK